MDNGKFLSEKRRRELSELKSEIITEAIETIENQGKYSFNIKCTGRGYYIKHLSFGIGYKALVEDIVEEISKKLETEIICSENYMQPYIAVELRKAT